MLSRLPLIGRLPLWRLPVLGSSAPRPKRMSLRYGGSPLQMLGRGDIVTSSTLIAPKTASSGKLKVHAISGYISSIFVCEYCDTDEFLILDTGMPSDVHRVQHFVEEVLNQRRLGGRCSTPTSQKEGEATAAPEDDSSGGNTEATQPLRLESCIKTVVSTHTHIDHIGSAFAYNDMGIQVAVADGYEKYYDGVSGRVQQIIDTGLSLFFARRLGRRFENPLLPLFTRQPLNPHFRLRDGSSPPGFPDWVAVAAHGHTCHMVMLYHPELHILYGADFFVAHKNEFRAPVPVDVDFAFDHTLHRLRKLPVRFVLLAHGGIVDCGDVGGWEFILDQVAVHRLKEDKNLGMKLIRRYLIGYSPEPAQYHRGMLPRHPLPQAWPQPAPVFQLD